MKKLHVAWCTTLALNVVFYYVIRVVRAKTYLFNVNGISTFGTSLNLKNLVEVFEIKIAAIPAKKEFGKN